MRIRMIAASVAAASVLAACGSSGSGLATGNAGRTSAAHSTAAGSTPPASTAPTIGGGGGGLAGGAYCDTIKGAKARLAALTGQNSMTFLAELNNVVAVMQQVDASAPADIKGSWDVVIAKITAFANVVRQAGITPAQLQNPSTITPQQAQALQAAGAQLDTADFKQATTKIESDVKGRCGFDISG